MKFVLIIIGGMSLSLGILGIFLPLLPTTPFVLLSAYCFSKSSRTLHQWLLQQPQLGAIIRNWERYGSISQQAKVMASLLMILGFFLSFWLLSVGTLVKAGIIFLGSGVLSYIWTRPLPPHETNLLSPPGLYPHAVSGRPPIQD